MSALSRIGVAIDSRLLEKFDKLIGRRGYTNRSEAFRDLIREELVQEAWESPDAPVVGTVTLVYDHHVRLLIWLPGQIRRDLIGTSNVNNVRYDCSNILLDHLIAVAHVQ